MKTARDTCPLLSLIRSLRASHAPHIINMYPQCRLGMKTPLLPLSHPIWPNRMYFHNTWHRGSEWTGRVVRVVLVGRDDLEANLHWRPTTSPQRLSIDK